MELQIMDMMLWNSGLSILVAVVGWFLKGALDSAKDTKERLNDLRVEVAQQYTHKNDLRDLIKSINERFDRIETKIDRLMENKNG
jgi:chromosome segregation ATPase